MGLHFLQPPRISTETVGPSAEQWTGVRMSIRLRVPATHGNAGQVYTNVQAAVDAARGPRMWSSRRDVQRRFVAGRRHADGLPEQIPDAARRLSGHRLDGAKRECTTILNPQSLGRALYIAYTPVVTVENMHFTQGQADRGGGVLVGSGVTATCSTIRFLWLNGDRRWRWPLHCRR
jgi:hypothetical protein